MSNKNGKGKYYLLGFLGLVVVLGVMYSNGTIDLKDLADTSGSSGVSKFTSPSQSASNTNDVQIYGKNFNFQTQTTDSLDVTITYGDDTEIDTICWDAHGSDDTDDWTKIGTLSEAETGDANIDLDEAIYNADGSLKSAGTTEMWCEVNLESSQDYFVDQAEIVKANDRIDSWVWVDANDDTDETFAFRYNLLQLTSTSDPNSEPSDTIQLFLFDEDTDGGAQTIMDTGVASALSVAQTDTTTELLTHLDFSNAGDVVVITEILFRNNLTSSTDSIFRDGTTEVCFDDATSDMVWYDTREPVGCLNISDKDLGDGHGGFDFDQLSSTQEYRWEAEDYHKGILVTVPKNANTQADTTLIVGTDFTASTDSICTELSYKYADAFENESSSDAVDIEVTSASSAGDECTIS